MKTTTPTVKFLAFSDHHADAALQQRMISLAEQHKIGLVFIPGDFSPHFQNEIPENMVGPFLESGARVYVLHGNHETQASAQFVEEKYKLTHFHGHGFVHEGVGFFGAGGADIGPFPTSDAEIFEALATSHNNIKHAKKKVMFTHVHPRNSITEKMCPVKETGSQAVLDAINTFKPDLVICGHIHEAGGIEETIGSTKVVNVACTGKIFEL